MGTSHEVTLPASQARLRRELGAEFQRLLLDTDSATYLLSTWLSTTIRVRVTEFNEAYEPTYQERRQLLFYQPTGCWRREAQLSTSNGTRISYATSVLLPERLQPHQQAAIRAGQASLGVIWSGAGVRRHATDERLLRDGLIPHNDAPWLEVSARVTVDGLPVALIKEQYLEELLYAHPRWMATNALKGGLGVF